MGEAKNRKREDKFYGSLPKNGKGIILSPPINIGKNGEIISVKAGIDPLEIRRSILFWDRLVKPINFFMEIQSSPDELFLKSCGILKEYKSKNIPTSGNGGLIYSQAHLNAFSELEASEPGIWAMSEGPNSFNLEAGEIFREGRGALVELHRAIPLPKSNVPLEDLLNFKEHRRDEIVDLSLELDSLSYRVSQAEDYNYEINRSIREIDIKCHRVILVGRESRIKFSLSNLCFGVSLDFHSNNLLTGGALGALIGTSFGLPIVGGAIGAASSMIKFSASFGGSLGRSGKSERLALSPYRVVSRLTNEPI